MSKQQPSSLPASPTVDVTPTSAIVGNTVDADWHVVAHKHRRRSPPAPLQRDAPSYSMHPPTRHVGDDVVQSQTDPSPAGVLPPPPGLSGSPVLERVNSLEQIFQQMNIPTSNNEAHQEAKQKKTRRKRNKKSNDDWGEIERRKKCGDKRDYFFRHLDYQVRNRLMVDDVAAFSVTDHEMATKISKIVLKLFDLPTDDPNMQYQLQITDGTACVGGNTLSFSEFFTTVNAVENDFTRYEMLLHNLSTLEKGNVSCYHSSYLDVMFNLNQDLVFLDPPWGGPDYKEQKDLQLYLDDVPIDEVVRRLRCHTKFVLLKAPSNFNLTGFKSSVDAKVWQEKGVKKMMLVVVQFC